jgi:hypothetical protein
VVFTTTAAVEGQSLLLKGNPIDRDENEILLKRTRRSGGCGDNLLSFLCRLVTCCGADRWKEDEMEEEGEYCLFLQLLFINRNNFLKILRLFLLGFIWKIKNIHKLKYKNRFYV